LFIETSQVHLTMMHFLWRSRLTTVNDT